MVKVAAQAGLYDITAPTPVLAGTRCGACSAVFFPPVGIGCPVCGATELEAMALAAAGTLHSQATVHLHRGKDIDAPFTVGEIALDDGPLVRALLTSDALEIGDRVTAEWVVAGTDDDGADKIEPRFGPAERSAAGGAS